MSEESWVHRGFDAFAAGSFEDGGSNLYVNAKGIIETIHRTDVDNDGYVDIVLPNAQGYNERGPTWIYKPGPGDGSDWERRELPTDSGDLCRIVDLDGDGLRGPDRRQLDQRRVVRAALPHLLGRARRAHGRADRSADGRRVRRGRRRRGRRRASGPGLSVRLGRPPQPGPSAAAARLPAAPGPAVRRRGGGVRTDRHRRAVGGRGRPERRRSRRPGGGQLSARVRVQDRLLPLLGHGGRFRRDASGASDRHGDAGLPGRLQRRRPAGDPVLRQQQGADLLERRGPVQPRQPPDCRDGGAQWRVPPRRALRHGGGRRRRRPGRAHRRHAPRDRNPDRGRSDRGAAVPAAEVRPLGARGGSGWRRPPRADRQQVSGRRDLQHALGDLLERCGRVLARSLQPGGHDGGGGGHRRRPGRRRQAGDRVLQHHDRARQDQPDASLVHLLRRARRGLRRAPPPGAAGGRRVRGLRHRGLRPRRVERPGLREDDGGTRIPRRPGRVPSGPALRPAVLPAVRAGGRFQRGRLPGHPGAQPHVRRQAGNVRQLLAHFLGLGGRLQRGPL